jgi:hypothetical protein
MTRRETYPGCPDFAISVEASPMATQIFKTAISLVAAAIVLVVISAGNPLVMFANATAPLVGTSAPVALTSDEIALFRQAAYQTETEISEPPAEALFKKFQAWAAEADRSGLVSDCKAGAAAQLQQPGHTVRAQVMHNARAEIRPRQMHRRTRPQHTARAEVRRAKHDRRQVRHKQHIPAHDRFAHNAQQDGASGT